MRCHGQTAKGNDCQRRVRDGERYCHSHRNQNDVIVEMPVVAMPEVVSDPITISHNEDIPSGEECVVCCEDLYKEPPLPCSHRIHLSCIEKSMKAECPICRAPLSLAPEIMNKIDENATAFRREIESEVPIDLIRHILNMVASGRHVVQREIHIVNGDTFVFETFIGDD